MSNLLNVNPHDKPKPLTIVENHQLIVRNLRTENPYINEMTPLIILTSSFQNNIVVENMSEMRNNIIKKIYMFSKNIPDDTQKHVAFIVSSTIDDLMLKKDDCFPSWSSETICSRIFKRRDSGVLFFKILENWCRESQKNKEKIAVALLCLNLGFKGKFSDKNNEKIELLRSKISHLFKHKNKIKSSSLLSIEGLINNDIKSKSFFSIALKILAALFFVMITFIVGMTYINETRSINSIEHIEKILFHP